MKISEFKKVIKEEVQRAIQEELSRMESEASLSENTAPQPVERQAPPQAFAPKSVNMFGANPLASMLEQTRANMTGEEYKNVMNFDSSMVSKPNFATTGASQMGMTSPENMPGLDLSQLGFVKNAKAVLDLANEKSKGKL